jgi:hypothetical protein
MKARTARLLLLAFVTSTAGVAWYASQAAEAFSTERVGLVGQRHQLIRSLQRAEQWLAQTENLRNRRQARLAALTTPPKASKPHLAPSPTRNFEEVLRDHPELQNLQSAAKRAKLFITYGPLYYTLHLTPAQIDEFERNILQREEGFSDLTASAHRQGLSLSDPAVQKLAQKIGQDYQSAQRALLGESGTRQTMEYEHLRPYRDVVSGLAEAAAIAGTPLAAGQAEQLVQVLASANPHRGTNLDNPAYTDWQLVHEQAKTFLSPDQLTFIETTEPISTGARFSSSLYAAVSQAAAEDAKNQSSSSTSTP